MRKFKNINVADAKGKNKLKSIVPAHIHPIGN